MREGYYMKKTLLISCMLLATTGAFANDAFTPINLSSAATTTKATTAVTGEETLGNGNIQNAILQIDNAQVDIRNQLLELKTKFADIDAQYVSVKTERKALKKQLDTAEKRLKSLDKAKEKMRKNML